MAVRVTAPAATTRVPAARLRDAWGTAAVALAVRLLVVLWAKGRFPAVEDGHYYDVLAQRLASGAGYTWRWPDGAVTYAAHYPVGYPALLAAAYVLFGASGGVAMMVNASLGAASAFALHRLVDAPGTARWRPAGAGLAVALHPALVPYTAAIMTEGVTASLLVVAAAVAGRARTARRPWAWIAAGGAVMALATLVRPQSLALAPVLGAFAVPRRPAASLFVRWGPRALGGAALMTGVALLCVAPWTARNCVRMHRCALVSVNAGWNLLIGATTTSGGWQPVAVPAQCATVWDEAGKDACFERAARDEIERAPASFVARAPAKIAMTLDYFGAAPWYLNAANASAFDGRAKVALASVETIASRMFLLAALVACGRLDGARGRARRLTALVGAAAALTLHAWIGYFAIPLSIAMAGRRAVVKAPMVVPTAAAVILATVAIHAMFFGAGRYGLAVVPFVTGLGFVGSRVARD